MYSAWTCQNWCKPMFIHVLGMQKCENRNDTKSGFFNKGPSVDNGYLFKYSIFKFTYRTYIAKTIRPKYLSMLFMIFSFKNACHSSAETSKVILSWMIHSRIFWTPVPFGGCAPKSINLSTYLYIIIITIYNYYYKI